jgi:hypothetical protein
MDQLPACLLRECQVSELTLKMRVECCPQVRPSGKRLLFANNRAQLLDRSVDPGLCRQVKSGTISALLSNEECSYTA